jgi:hypothetical protein
VSWSARKAAIQLSGPPLKVAGPLFLRISFSQHDLLWFNIFSAHSPLISCASEGKEMHNYIYNSSHLFPLPVVEPACASSATVETALLPCQNGFRTMEWIKELRAFPIPATAPAKAIVAAPAPINFAPSSISRRLSFYNIQINIQVLNLF